MKTRKTTKKRSSVKKAAEPSTPERYFSLCLVIAIGVIVYAVLSIVIDSFFRPDGWVNAPGTVVKSHIEWGWVIFWTIIVLALIAGDGWLLYSTYSEGLTFPQQGLVLVGAGILAIDCYRAIIQLIFR